jgi:hypothetical protein
MSFLSQNYGKPGFLSFEKFYGYEKGVGMPKTMTIRLAGLPKKVTGHRIWHGSNGGSDMPKMLEGV